MTTTIDLVEFGLGRELYALDIQLAREIVEMMPITSIPRSPAYLSGIMNLRGEITTILNLGSLLGLQQNGAMNGQKIIVLVPDAAGGANIGIIVDDVHSVIQVPDTDIEKLNDGMSSEISTFVKGIIKLGCEDGDKSEKKKSLVIWIDMQKILRDLVNVKCA
jgi:purine-binding chemotaxis protein CheW